MSSNEINNKNETKIIQKKHLKILIIGVLLIILTIIFLVNREGSIKTKVKTSLDRVVEKSDLETVNFTYNVIAKQCKDKNKCNKKSNNIDDFEYVISCKGTITTGIDFKEVKIEIDKSNKTLVVKMPKSEIKDTNILTMKLLNGADIPANELPSARALCEETISEKSKNDEKVISATKEQAEVVLESFYQQWIKSIDEEYKVEVK